ncbi:hypothetical protein H6G97_19830 [Nostoc flagelliforme FACHB-838]|uniref:Uncharacterized protein n=1 Tax=Nostoc flagelliforme FACHB-838 TaxID=2692904 RepID=A0ABR8DQI4_9NOSO|nr:hypothetical protein [Nostoc flagelliforme]MBD2531722.1 hypothetical protein [Nostoc flagelliforme FACHB-838]
MILVDTISRQQIPEQLNPHFLNFSQTNLSTVSLSTEKRDSEKLRGDNTSAATTPEPSVLLAPIVLLAMSTVVIFHKLKLSEQNNKLNNLEPFPCRNCHFFNQSKHLKCAVNPSAVFTKAATNCHDYHPLKSKKNRSFKTSEHK